MKLILNRSLVLLLGALLVFASTALIASASGALVATNCKPPGVRNYWTNPTGMDGFACTAIGTEGGTITGVCFAGGCRAVGFSTGGDALSMFTNSLIQNATQGLVEQLLGGLFGTGYSDDYSTTTGDYVFDDYLDDYDYDDYDLDLDYVFDDSTELDYTTGTVTETYIFDADDYRETEVTVVSVPNSVSEDDLDGYTTSLTQFELELLTSSFNTDSYTSTEGGISLADLERDAAEARAREALLNEQNGISNDQSDWRGSNAGGYNPLSTGGYEEEEEKEKAWWQKILAALGL